MKYIVAIEPGDESNPDYGVIVPDLKGCYSQGETLEDALNNAKEAIECWLEAALDSGMDFPTTRTIEQIRKENPEWSDWIWSVVDVDFSTLENKAERINITISRRVLRRLDDKARRCGDTRSGYIARMVMSANMV